MLFLAGTTDQFCIDRTITYIIAGGIAIIAILVAVIVLCGCVWVAVCSSSKLSTQENGQPRARRSELDGPDYTMKDREHWSSWTDLSHCPQPNLPQKSVSETDITMISNHEQFLDDLYRERST